MTTSADGFAHPALLYDGPDQYLDQIGSFIGAERAAGRPVLAAVPRHNLDLLRDDLGRDGDRVRWIDLTEAGRNPGRILATVLTAFADEHPGQRVAMVDEPIWAERSGGAYAAGVQHEALVNLAFAGRAATVLCPYDTSRLSASVLCDAARTHPELVQAGHHRRSAAYADPATIAATALDPLPDPPADAATLMVLDAADLRTVRDFVNHHAAALGLDADKRADLELAADEAVSNTVTHTEGSGVIRLWRDHDAVICEVHDDGHIRDPLAGRRVPALGDEHGYGLLLMHQLCDLVHVRTGEAGTTIHLHAEVGSRHTPPPPRGGGLAVR